MAAQYCMTCGAPLPSGASACSFCGRPVDSASGQSASLPLPGNPPAGPSGAPAPAPFPQAGPSPRPRHRWLRIIAVVIVVVIVLVAAVAIYGYYTTVDVTALNVYAPDNVCDLNVYLISYTGFNASVHSSLPISLEVPNNNTTSCVLRGVTTNTSGFSVENVQLPGPIPGNASGVLSNETLNFTLTIPGNNYNGPVNLIFR